MMRIKAYIKKVKGKTKHCFSGSIDNTPTMKWVEISEEPDGVYLYYFNIEGECVSDTWHETVKEAKEQAFFEFEIRDSDWIPMQ